MTLVIAAESPASPSAAALLAASDAFSATYYPPESNHTVGLDVLLRPEVTFLIGRLDGSPVGCGALVRGRGVTAELKRLFVAETARSQGVGRALLDALEDHAGQDGIALVQLETGIHSHAALTLYARAGYLERGSFGAYKPDPLSVYMEKRLALRP